MGYIADEPLGDALDAEGLDSPGRSLREQQRKAQAIDRDLPENTMGIDWSNLDEHIADTLRQKESSMDRIRKAYGGPVTGRQVGKSITPVDARHLRDMYRQHHPWPVTKDSA